MKKVAITIGILLIVGLGIGLANYSIINSYLNLGNVYVAKVEIPAHTKIESKMFKVTKWPKKNIADDAITTKGELSKLVGKITRTTIVEEQPLQKALISEAHTIREINQNISEGYVTMTVPIEDSDVPINEIHRDDVISLVGVRTENSDEGQKIIAGYVAENLLVLDTVVDKSSASGKLLVLVPRQESATLAANLVAGKIRIAIDPQKFVLKKE